MTGWDGLAQVHKRIIAYFGVEKGSRVPNIVIWCTCRPLLNDAPSVLNLSAPLAHSHLFPLLFPALFTTIPSPFPPFSPPSIPMLRYPTQSDHRYGDPASPTAPQPGSTYWAPPGLDTDQPAVTRDPEDRHGPSRLRANQLTSSAYPSATPPFSLNHRDSYPSLGQTQSDCPDQFAYPPQQQYISGVNYAAPPYDLAEYPVGYPLCPHDPAEHSPSFPLDHSR